jgi:hypothetical protein
MFLLDKIAEARISEAVKRGELEKLPGTGKALQLDDDHHIPEELRVAYRILKNAGYVPMEIELRREINQVEQLLTGIEDAAEKNRITKKLNYLMTRLSFSRGTKTDLRVEAAYYEKLRKKLEEE